VESDDERLLHGVLGDVDITAEPDHRRQRPAELLPEDPADDRVVDQNA
jgi:hypothetical protein